MAFIDWTLVPVQQLGPGVRIRTPHGERIMLSLVEIDAGAVVPAHSHPHEQAGVVLEGELELTIAGEPRVLRAGESYIIPGGAEHSARSVNGPCRALDIFSPIREDYARGHNDFVGSSAAESQGFRWNPGDYAQSSAAQLAWAKELLGRLALRGDEAVLDVGCGDGKVTAQIAASLPRGFVLGTDSSNEMIDFARKSFPTARHSNLEFRRMDARELQADRNFDVVFSNAALHWVDDHPAVLRGVAALLEPGGRLVISCGGKGNTDALLEVVESIVASEDWRRWFSGFRSPWFFHGTERYPEWLREAGLRADRVELVPKDMSHDGPDGLAAWLRTTWMPYTHRLPEARREPFIAEIVAAYLARHPLDGEGRTHVGMVRLEVEAMKAGGATQSRVRS